MEKNEFQTYRNFKISVIHFYSVYALMLDICLTLNMFFNVDVGFESVILRLLLYILLPFIVGILKVVFIDSFFNRISVKIKWIFTIVVFAYFAFLGLYSFLQFRA